MSAQTEQRLKAALQRVDDRLVALQCRHRERGDIPLYEADLGPPATDQEMKELENALGFTIPFELAYCLERWNGRFIAPDHAIVLNPISDLIYAANRSAMRVDDVTSTFEEVVGPVNLLFESRKRIFFGEHDWSGSSLFLDYIPAAGGQLGQVIRIGEDPIAKYVVSSFVGLLNLVADAPAYDDDPEFDPLAWKPWHSN